MASRPLVVLTLLGFPIALVIAWAFEMTPEGMKRTEDVSPTENIPQWSRRKFVGFLVGVAVIAAAFFAFSGFPDEDCSQARSAARACR